MEIRDPSSASLNQYLINVKGWHSRGYLPHYDTGQKIQHVTVHLGDSLPATARRRIDEHTKLSPRPKRALTKLQLIHNTLDEGHGACWLNRQAPALLVKNALFHFDGERYDLHAWVIMPNHFHALFRPYDDWLMSKTISSWKGFTAKEIRKWIKENELIEEKPQKHFWQPEYWDRYIRDKAHYERVVQYIHQNPVKAGLCQRVEDWPWSSAANQREA